MMIHPDASTIKHRLKPHEIWLPTTYAHLYPQILWIRDRYREIASKAPKKMTTTLVSCIESDLLSELLNDWIPDQIAGRLGCEGITTLQHSMLSCYVYFYT